METVNQEENIEKTFTQADVDRIVADRLKRDREKYADYDVLKEKAAKLDEIDEKNKSELQKATEKASALQAELDGLKKAAQIRAIREKVASATGVPASFLTGETEDDCTEQAKALGEWKNPSAYPNVRDAGEANVSQAKKSTREQFAAWFNSNIG